MKVKKRKGKGGRKVKVTCFGKRWGKEINRKTFEDENGR